MRTERGGRCQWLWKLLLVLDFFRKPRQQSRRFSTSSLLQHHALAGDHPTHCEHIFLSARTSRLSHGILDRVSGQPMDTCQVLLLQSSAVSSGIWVSLLQSPQTSRQSARRRLLSLLWRNFADKTLLKPRMKPKQGTVPTLTLSRPRSLLVSQWSLFSNSCLSSLRVALVNTTIKKATTTSSWIIVTRQNARVSARTGSCILATGQ